ncbi:MAG: glucoamylase family protein [Luteimonas sp.]
MNDATPPADASTNPALADFGETRLDTLQRHAFDYFLDQTSSLNGLVADTSQRGSDASIAAVGFGLACYPVGVERSWITRADAVERILSTLRFFRDSTQDTTPDATGYKGFYYHFLDMTTGRRAGRCEVSTVDSGFLLAGMLTAASFFDQDDEQEREIRDLTDLLYQRADWQWACNGGATLTHGWKPETGFLRYRWQGYDEALLLYVLGLGSPTHPLPVESYTAWASTYQWKVIDGYEYLYGGPLFIHQYSHCWLDFRGIQDAFMRDKGIDYFENSRRATYAQRAYAVRNPLEFAGYGTNFWGLTASDGPGWTTRRIQGIDRTFFDYIARGTPYGPDDGTIAPWAVAASLPFAPEIVLPAIRHLLDAYPQASGNYCFRCSINPTYSSESAASLPWTSDYHFGINLGPVVMMCENFRSGLVWVLMRASPHIMTGLWRAGFTNGWL